MLNYKLLTFALLTASCVAQTREPHKFYKLDFTVKELDGGRLVNSRSYLTSIGDSDPHHSSIRTGSKVPIPSSPNSGQFTFVEVGVSIDCDGPIETPQGLDLHVSVDVSSLPPDPANSSILRQNKWSGLVLVPFKKPTIIFSSDDVTTKRQIQIELTATPIL